MRCKGQRSWLQIRPHQGHVETFWVVLENGLISAYRDPKDNTAKFVFPLQSSTVHLNDNKERVNISCWITNSRLELCASGDQLSDWHSGIALAIKEWMKKKRKSILYKNRMHFNNTQGQSFLNTEEELPTTSVTTQKENYQRLCVISMLPEEERVPWTDLPEVAVTRSADRLSSHELEANELKFELVVSEIVYNQELSQLVELVRSSIHWKDSLPLFNRRSIVGCAVRVKKCSNTIVKRLCSEWSKADSLATDLHQLYNILESYYDAHTAQILVAYCDVLDDARCMIRRATLNDSSLMSRAFSARCHIEYTLLPIRHLHQTYNTLHKILQLLHSSESGQHYLQCQQLILTVSGILDYCYKVLHQHGSNYLADIDNQLDFSSKLSTIKLKRRSSSVSNISKKNLNPLLNTATDNFKNTKLDLNESFNLIDLRSMENLLIESKVDETSNTKDKDFPFRNSCGSSTSGEGCFEMIELNVHNDSDQEQADGQERLDRLQDTSGMSCSGWYRGTSNRGERHVLQKSFEDEPLYQAYTQIVQKSTMGVEEKRPKVQPNSVFYTYLDLPENIYEDIDGKDKKPETTVKPAIGLRTLWCETDEVIGSGVLSKLSSSQKALQEYKFEILTSEVSYLKSINVLITLFVESLELTAVLDPEERRSLYGNILEVRRVSEIFLFDLAGHWEEDYMLSNIYSVVHRHSLASFRVYIEFCSNQVHFHRTLQHLLLHNKEFVDIVMRIETSPECHGYSLQSFLSLPMQRVTRLPLLLQAIQRRLSVGTTEYTSCRVTLSALNQLVHECNEAVRKIEQSEQILALNNILNQVGSTDKKTEPTEENVEKRKKKLSITRSWKLFSLQES